jgi:hypothetical protein
VKEEISKLFYFCTDFEILRKKVENRMIIAETRLRLGSEKIPFFGCNPSHGNPFGALQKNWKLKLK